jgi:hypothetical protein
MSCPANAGCVLQANGSVAIAAAARMNLVLILPPVKELPGMSRLDRGIETTKLVHGSDG